ncbi:hypothetical protein KUTeg_018793 [Tegillarca granosa]|uniref:Uncharacterized protein n=1 Tax=Tegillarca granosa TaxID=220873 RepID=A0ABQ9EEE4_TEGGR|nr:hypothetical protein KUTeg_018793 [Tegillarca granosa]
MYLDLDTSNGNSSVNLNPGIPEIKVSDLEDIPFPDMPVMQIPRLKKNICRRKGKIFKATQADSTKRNTTWAVNIFQEWNNERYGCDANVLEISVEELAKKLEAKPKPKKNQQTRPSDKIYTRNSLINMRAAINRHISDLHRNNTIVNGLAFRNANGVLDGLLKTRLQDGIEKPSDN